MSHLVDLSHDLKPGMPVYPGDPPLEVVVQSATEDRESSAAGGSPATNLSSVSIGLHCGTHMDAPFHFFGDGRTIEQVPLEQCAGPTVLARLPGHGAGSVITEHDLAGWREALRETGKVVLQTGWDRRWGEPEYFTAHPALTAGAARFLVACGVHLVGVDFPSVDHPPYGAHLILLGAGAVIVENLTNLEAIRGERFQLFALPLRVVGRDGSPVRVVGTEL